MRITILYIMRLIFALVLVSSVSTLLTTAAFALPSAPVLLVAEAENTKVHLSWFAGDDNGAAITGFEYSTDGGVSFKTLSFKKFDDIEGLPVVYTAWITGLTNGITYQIAIRAVYSQGSGAISNIISATPAAVPSAPTSLAGTAGNGQVSLTWVAGADNGAAITNYEYSKDNGVSFTAFSPAETGTSATITGLTNGTSYQIAIRAVNSVGFGVWSENVNLTPMAGTNPDAPTITGIEPSTGEVVLSFTAGADGGSAISGYEYALSTDSQSPDSSNTYGSWQSAVVSDSKLTISGLTDETLYRVKIRAINSVGAGAESAYGQFTTGVSDVASTQTVVVSEEFEIAVADGSDQVEIKIQLRDPVGNPITTGGASVFASTNFGTLTQNPTGTTIPMRDNGDGTYTVLLSSSNPGEATVSISVNSVNAGAVTIKFNSASLRTVVTGQSSFNTADNLDVVFTFARDVSGFSATDVNAANASVVSVSGGPKAYTVRLKPSGKGDITVSAPGGVATATDGSGDVNQTSNILTITNGIVDKTRENIATFMLQRSNLLASNQPSLIHLLKTDQGGAFNATATRGSADIEGHYANANQWVSITSAWGEQQSYALGAVGAHVSLGENGLVGAMLQFDHYEHSGTRTSGTGWLTGPYVVGVIEGQNINYEGRLLYGHSSNKISPDGTYTDSFDTKRLLAQFKLQGAYQVENVSWMPLFDFSYVSDKQLTYTDSLGNLISEQTVELLQTTAGLDFELPLNVDDGNLAINGGLSAIYSRTVGGTSDFSGLRGRAEFGGTYIFDTGVSLGIQTFYDGLGTNHKTYGARVNLKYNLEF